MPALDQVTTADIIARDLLRIGAFVFSPSEPFTWASGIESPIYCDNRLILGHPDVRARVVSAFVAEIATHEAEPPEVVLGTATAGIPHAAWIADRLNLPMGYVRSAAKKHGKGRAIEGIQPSDQRGVLIEDLVSTGGSSLSAITLIREAGLTINSVYAIFSYGLDESANRFAGSDTHLYTLTGLESLLQVAVADGRLSEEEAQDIAHWRERL